MDRASTTLSPLGRASTLRIPRHWEVPGGRAEVPQLETLFTHKHTGTPPLGILKSHRWERPQRPELEIRDLSELPASPKDTIQAKAQSYQKYHVFNKTAGRHYANVKLMRRRGRETGVNQTLNQISGRIAAKLLLTCTTQFCSRYT